MNLPATTEELLLLLDELIPEPAPRPHDNMAQVMFEAGRRSVVLQLRELRANKVPLPLREKRGEGRIVRRQDT